MLKEAVGQAGAGPGLEFGRQRGCPSAPRSKGAAMYNKIVVGTDGSPTADVAVRHAVSLAKATGAELPHSECLQGGVGTGRHLS